MLIIQKFISFLAQPVSLTYDLNGFMCIVNRKLYTKKILCVILEDKTDNPSEND